MKNFLNKFFTNVYQTQAAFLKGFQGNFRLDKQVIRLIWLHVPMQGMYSPQMETSHTYKECFLL